MKRILGLTILAVVVGFAGCGDDPENQGNQEPAPEGEVRLVQADAVEASSEWSADYQASNLIDGSGLPDDFGPEDTHAAYEAGNHWTTTDGDVEGAWVLFLFDDPVAMDRIWVWNHRSTVPPAYSGDYGVTEFLLELLDIHGAVLFSLEGVADPSRADGQEFVFALQEDVSDIRFTVLENAGEPLVTGLAEVAFGVRE